MRAVKELPFSTRFWFAFVVFVRTLVDPHFAREVWQLRQALPPAGESTNAAPTRQAALPDAKAGETLEPKRISLPAPPDNISALQLLALLQHEGRFVDFVEQAVDGFSDEEVAAAARVVHDGCRKALHGAGALEPVKAEDEGSKITVPKGFSPAEIKLTGNVAGPAPFSGTLRHRGWKMSRLVLPSPAPGHDPSILAPAEVEV